MKGAGLLSDYLITRIPQAIHGSNHNPLGGTNEAKRQADAWRSICVVMSHRSAEHSIRVESTSQFDEFPLIKLPTDSDSSGPLGRCFKGCEKDLEQTHTLQFGAKNRAHFLGNSRLFRFIP
jgi:hypothetical protein